MASTVFPVASAATTTRFPAMDNSPFNIPAGLTLQNTVTSTTTFTTLPAQVWAVIVGGGGAGGSTSDTCGGGGGGGVVIGWVDVPTAGITATIGAGGTAVASDVGNRGGTTSFGSIGVSGGGGGCRGSGMYIFEQTPAIPLTGLGMAGYGGSGGTSTLASLSGNYMQGPMGAPFGKVPGSLNLTSGTNPNMATTISHKNNFRGGGAGSWAVSSLIGAGSGYTGGGGNGGIGATQSAGGNSSRDGGVSNTFTGGAIGSNNGGAGAGLLANGGAATVSIGGTGGSGGGGGGGGSFSLTAGPGGAGCVLIYY